VLYIDDNEKLTGPHKIFDWAACGLDIADLELSKYLELRGDKFRDLKNESTTLKFKQQNCNSFHPSKRAHSVQNTF